jgi:hypothetical protein
VQFSRQCKEAVNGRSVGHGSILVDSPRVEASS